MIKRYIIVPKSIELSYLTCCDVFDCYTISRSRLLLYTRLTELPDWPFFNIFNFDWFTALSLNGRIEQECLNLQHIFLEKHIYIQ